MRGRKDAVSGVGGRLATLSTPEGLCLDGRYPPGSPVPGCEQSVGDGQEPVMVSGTWKCVARAPGGLGSEGQWGDGDRGRQDGSGKRRRTETLWEGKGGFLQEEGQGLLPTIDLLCF